MNNRVLRAENPQETCEKNQKVMQEIFQHFLHDSAFYKAFSPFITNNDMEVSLWEMSGCMKQILSNMKKKNSGDEVDVMTNKILSHTLEENILDIMYVNKGQLELALVKFLWIIKDSMQYFHDVLSLYKDLWELEESTQFLEKLAEWVNSETLSSLEKKVWKKAILFLSFFIWIKSLYLILENNKSSPYEKNTQNSEKTFLMIFYYFIISSEHFSVVNNPWVEKIRKVKEENKIHKKVNDVLWKSPWDRGFESFLESYLFAFEGWEILEKSPWVMKILFAHQKLFFHKTRIPYSFLFQFLKENCDEYGEKIFMFLEEIKSLKFWEDVIIALLKTQILTGRVLSNYPFVKTLIEEDPKFIKNIKADHAYIEKKEIEAFILEKQKDLEYLPENEVHKENIIKILSQTKSWPRLQESIMSYYIKNDIENLILRYKNLFWFSKHNISEKMRYYEILVQNFSYLKNFEFLIKELFSRHYKNMASIAEISEKILFDENISSLEIQKCFENIMNSWELFQDLDCEEKIYYKDFISQIDVWNLKIKFSTTLSSLYKKENISFFQNDLNSLPKTYHKLSKIIKIWNKISDEFQEDFLLKYEEYSPESIESFLKTLNFLHHYKISVQSFEEIEKFLEKQTEIRFIMTHVNNYILENTQNLQELKQVILDYIFTENTDVFLSYIKYFTHEDRSLARENPYDKHLVEIYLQGNEVQKQNLIDQIYKVLHHLITQMHPSITSSTSNSQFWSGSGSYSEIIVNYVFKKLKQDISEDNDEYLKRICQIQENDFLWIQSVHDINGSHELKCFYSVLVQKEKESSFFDFLENIGNYLSQISWETKIDLEYLTSYYKKTLKNAYKKAWL